MLIASRHPAAADDRRRAQLVKDAERVPRLTAALGGFRNLAGEAPR
jgi:hypothetical protein